MINDNEDYEIIKPVILHDDGEVPIPKSVFNIDNEVNGKDRFAITSLSENGKYLRDGFLYYKFNGVNIYTSINNIIFVDKINNTVFVREQNKMISSAVNPTNPEERQYIILYTDLGDEESDNEFPYRWEACQGRLNAYEYIKLNAALIDIDKSIVLVDDVPINKSLSVRQFVNHLRNSDMLDKYDDFDINDYFGSESF